MAKDFFGRLEETNSDHRESSGAEKLKKSQIPQKDTMI